MSGKHIYLGDAVYAELFPEGLVILRTGRHDNDKGRIFLEPDTWRSLILLLTREGFHEPRSIPHLSRQ